MSDWRSPLTADPIPWLLEPENPAVRYGTLRDLLDQQEIDLEVRIARAMIPFYPPIADVLDSQKRDGRWGSPDFYLPKFSGTSWTLEALADAGFWGAHESIRSAVAFIFTFQRESGAFCRRRRVSGKGMVWREEPGPCTHARIVRALIRFGYGEDPRTRRAVGWLLEHPREDGMWHCQAASRCGCLRATLDVLRVAALDDEMRAHPAVARGAAAVAELLVEPRMSRYHSKEMWRTLQYPYIDYSVISALDALGHLGYSTAHPKVAAALEVLLSRQRPDGTWPLDESVRRPAFDVGPVGEPNKWLTLDALRVIRLLHA